MYVIYVNDYDQGKTKKKISIKISQKNDAKNGYCIDSYTYISL